ncbi:hypothetical protein HanXRQr2_Chr12g0525871 [Helianthus annuus]|uniref:Uncharacterized protein n=1 Tax=Helianthus annuus TaxID=4232 RepID=A0A251SZT3_HELAN|nr:hypothetical protein HanXRQr2_Chr12g0525871 [Helianthus annuus]KAJ0488260.1 hypothetical protein HanHA300_Chr12g0430981 [Helianthus annuus]KAJ0504097.1 hypothetical protein HanHA89_Chr12g0455541 [Helianthus annuus]KAJ0673786.1 hypothetical protein HanLR1_Chr12g0432851 [Helianthus annuus]KAJ0861438.1 hypothetical protein HanPSC8_Chr12g0506661 [Helianthus annuus]
MVGMRKTLVFYKVPPPKRTHLPFFFTFPPDPPLELVPELGLAAELDRRPNAFFIFEQRRKLWISATTVKIFATTSLCCCSECK